MLRKIFGTTAAVALLLTLVQVGADAKKPLDVDCSALEVALVTTDAILDDLGADFASLGELVSESKKDPVLFGQLRVLITLTSGGLVDFTDAREVVPTIAGCGLVPLLVDLIRT